MAVMHEVTDTVVLPVVEDGPVTTNIGVPGLWLVKATDVDRLTVLLRNAWRVRELWDDEASANPGLWFMSHYTAPHNLLFDVMNGSGFVAFIRTVVGWRSQIYAAAWARPAMRRDDLLRDACKLAMLTLDLRVIDSFVKLDNRLSQRRTLQCGFVNRGSIRNAQCYNGVLRPMYWNEIDRATLGLTEET